MPIGILADTHDNLAAVEAALAVFADRGVERILHCGDVIAPPMLEAFEGYHLDLVLGNNDGEVAGLRAGLADLDPPGTCHGRFGVVEVDGMRCAMMHGERLAEVDACARSGAFDLVLHGHHHETRRETVDGTNVINPGGHFPTIPPKHRNVGLLAPGSGTVELVNLQDTT